MKTPEAFVVAVVPGPFTVAVAPEMAVPEPDLTVPVIVPREALMVRTAVLVTPE